MNYELRIKGQTNQQLNSSTIKQLKKQLYITLIVTAALASCKEGYTPKPRAFFRIDLPEKAYVLFDDRVSPYTYEIPVYAEVVPYETEGEKFWANINFPSLNATINMSYKSLRQAALRDLVADAMTFVDKHQGKAMRIRELAFDDQTNRVFGMLFDIGGVGVASTYQFYLTDSNRHFVRGALYFEGAPNNDSLAPVVEFLKFDMDRLIETFTWR